MKCEVAEMGTGSGLECFKSWTGCPLKGECGLMVKRMMVAGSTHKTGQRVGQLINEGKGCRFVVGAVVKNVAAVEARVIVSNKLYGVRCK